MQNLREISNVRLFQDEDIFVINDIKPASKYHLLVIPRKHIVDAKYLTKDDIPLCKFNDEFLACNVSFQYFFLINFQ